MSEIKSVADSLVVTVKDFVTRSLSPLLARFQQIEERVAAIPAGPQGEPGVAGPPGVGEAGPPGKDAEVDYERVSAIIKSTVGAAFDVLPVPKDGRPGDNGKDAVVDYDKVGDIISVAVAKEVAKVPVPKDGAPGRDAVPVDYGHIGEIIKAAAINAVAELPKPVDGKNGINGINGKDADIGPVSERLLEFCRQQTAQIPDIVQRAVSALPPPKVVDEDAVVARVLAAVPIPKDGAPGVNGRDADEDAIVARVLTLVPIPKNGEPGPPGEPGSPGRDADPELVRAEVQRMITELPRPSVDADAIAAAFKAAVSVELTPVDEESIVGRVLERIPTPKDGTPGRDFDPDLMRAEIQRMFAEMPKPKDGESVHPDTVARMVSEAVEKFASTIRLPADGKPGRDALDLEIIESIEQGKSYPAGTFALHDGGTVLAVRDTDPIEQGLDAAGWKVTQDGIKDVRSEQVDERTFRVTFIRTSGRTDVRDFTPSFANVDKGPFRPGMKYLAGDGVTRDLGFWIARRDTEKAPPHDDWRLAIKGKWRA